MPIFVQWRCLLVGDLRLQGGDEGPVPASASVSWRVDVSYGFFSSPFRLTRRISLYITCTLALRLFFLRGFPSNALRIFGRKHHGFYTRLANFLPRRLFTHLAHKAPTALWQYPTAEIARQCLVQLITLACCRFVPRLK